MKINLNFQFKNLAGKEYDKFTKEGEIIELHHAAKCLGTCMWLSSDKSLKFKIWGEQLYKHGFFEVDEADLDLIIAWIEIYGSDPQKPYNGWFAQVGIKGQVIDSMKRQKEKIKK